MDRNPRNSRGPRHRPQRNINPFGEGNARAVAYDIATKAFRGEERFEHIWKSHPGLVQLTPRDRALAVHLASGVLRQYRRLDAQARLLTSGKSEGLSDSVQWILRLGLFQVLDCDRIPAHAAVSTAVDATKKVSHQGIAGLMNAVLRRAVREKESPPATDQPSSEPLTWGERFSMPDWMAEVLLERFGRDAGERIARWANSPPHYYFRLSRGGAGLERINGLLGEMHLSPARPHRDLPEYVAIETAALISDSPLFKEPLGWVQNPAGGLVVALLGLKPGDTIIDLFAAPGGKTLAISEIAGPSGQVLAVDKNADRLRLLAENKSRFSAENILPIEADIASLGDRVATHVLADVPCSALGTLPKNPEVRWTKSSEDVSRLARSQRIWLSVAATHVAEGGVLVYSTCTIPRQENEDIVQAFLEANATFELESAAGHVPARYVTAEGFLATNPPQDGLDGVFAARLRRRPSV
jgi:16S rRNA (cytosine967-C5)-methyltransferase